jgi:hypothetical protein
LLRGRPPANVLRREFITRAASDTSCFVVFVMALILVVEVASFDAIELLQHDGFDLAQISICDCIFNR